MTGNSWVERAHATLARLSTTAKPLIVAVREWGFTGNTIVHSVSDQVCELCGQIHLKYQFEIVNCGSGIKLWVGSSCILNLGGITVHDDSGRLIVDHDARKKQLMRKLKQSQRHEILKPLRMLYRKDIHNRSVILGYVDRYVRKGTFLPKDLSDLLYLMDGHSIQYETWRYPVDMRSDDAKAQIANMDAQAVRTIEAALSTKQKGLLSKAA